MKHLFTLAVVFGFSLLKNVATNMLESDFRLLESLLEMENYDTHIFLNQDTNPVVYKRLMEGSQSISWSLDDIQLQDCDNPAVLYEESKRPKLILLYHLTNESMNEAMTSLEASVTDCPLEIRPGLFHASNLLVYIPADDSERLKFGQNRHVQRQANAFIFERKDDKFLTSTFDFCQGIWRHLRVLDPYETIHLASEEDKLSGCKLRVGNMPYDYYTIAKEAENPASPRHFYTERRGFDVWILEHAGLKLGCRFEYLNPPDFTWGQIVEGQFSGMVGDLVREEVDVITGGITIHLKRANVRLYRLLSTVLLDVKSRL